MTAAAPGAPRSSIERRVSGRSWRSCWAREQVLDVTVTNVASPTSRVRWLPCVEEVLGSAPHLAANGGHPPARLAGRRPRAQRFFPGCTGCSPWPRCCGAAPTHVCSRPPAPGHRRPPMRCRGDHVEIFRAASARMSWRRVMAIIWRPIFGPTLGADRDNLSRRWISTSTCHPGVRFLAPSAVIFAPPYSRKPCVWAPRGV